MKSRSKIVLFSNERHFEIWFPKKRTITFFWSKLSKLHKKDPILHVATTFSLKQGETRTSHGPIPHSLTYVHYWYCCFLLDELYEDAKWSIDASSPDLIKQQSQDPDSFRFKEAKGIYYFHVKTQGMDTHLPHITSCAYLFVWKVDTLMVVYWCILLHTASKEMPGANNFKNQPNCKPTQNMDLSTSCFWFLYKIHCM